MDAWAIKGLDGIVELLYSIIIYHYELMMHMYMYVHTYWGVIFH